MKNIRTHLLATVAALFSVTLVVQARPNSFIRYNVDSEMTSTGVDADATGRVQVFLKQQGNSDHRRVRVRVSHLDPSATFTLQALVGDSAEPVAVGTFTTDARGKAIVVYAEHVSLRENAPASALRKNKHALPENIFDLTAVRSLAVVNANSEVVLTSDLRSAESLNYQVATAFKNTGTDPDAIGVMAAAVQSGTIQFRLFAMGQSSEYSLVINNESVANYSADFSGRIAVGSYPSKAPGPMQFRDVSLRNSADVVILESHVR